MQDCLSASNVTGVYARFCTPIAPWKLQRAGMKMNQAGSLCASNAPVSRTVQEDLAPC